MKLLCQILIALWLLLPFPGLLLGMAWLGIRVSGQCGWPDAHPVSAAPGLRLVAHQARRADPGGYRKKPMNRGYPLPFVLSLWKDCAAPVDAE